MALCDLSLTIPSGDFLAIVGPSGCGKSTFLRLLAGIEEPSTGTIDFHEQITHHGQISFTSDPYRVGIVFQDNTIFPWMTVERNLAYPLELKYVPRHIRIKRAAEIAETLGLEPDRYLQKYPRELSGGEQRRVAIGSTCA